MVVSEALTSRLENFQKLLYRTVERLLKKPYHDGGFSRKAL